MVYNHTIARLGMGYLVDKVLQDMHDKEADKNGRKDVYLNSGHGSDLATMLKAINALESPPYGPFASAVFIELWEKEEGNQKVSKIPTPIPQISKLRDFLDTSSHMYII